MKNKKICVFLSAQSPGELYEKEVMEFGRLMAENEFSLVWGGSDHGLMKVIADSVKEHGGKLYGVSVKILAHKARKDADDMKITDELWERRKIMLESADAVVAMPGGNGTLDEITEAIELRKLGQYNKPIAFLNINGFYDHIKRHYEMLDQKRFLPLPINKIIRFYNTAQETIEYLNVELENEERLVNPYLK